MPTIKDSVYTFFLELDKSFQEKYIARFLELSGEPRVWDGVNLHTFYEVFSVPEKALYIIGDTGKSTNANIYISGKIVPLEKAVEAGQICSRWRQSESLFCETVEEVCLSLFNQFPNRINQRFHLSNKGLDEAIEIVKNIPELNY